MRPTRSLRGAPTVLLVGLFAVVASTAPAVEPAARFELSSDPAQLVIAFSEHIGEIESDDHPWLRIYAEGEVVRHRPAYFKNPGDFTGQLSEEELSALVRSLVDRGVMDFDPEAVREVLSRARQGESTLFEASDESTFEIEVHLKAYQPGGSLTPQEDFHKYINWQGLRADARRYPGVAALGDLWDACSELAELGDRVEQESAQGDEK